MTLQVVGVGVEFLFQNSVWVTDVLNYRLESLVSRLWAQMCLYGRFTLEDSKERVAGLFSQRWWWWPGLELDEKTLVCQLEVTGSAEWQVHA